MSMKVLRGRHQRYVVYDGYVYERISKAEDVGLSRMGDLFESDRTVGLPRSGRVAQKVDAWREAGEPVLRPRTIKRRKLKVARPLTNDGHILEVGTPVEDALDDLEDHELQVLIDEGSVS